MKPLSTPLIDYQTFTSVEKVGAFPLHIQALKDMEKSLDEICAKYEPKSPEEESRLLDLCPYFGIVWPSARALALFMSERKTQFNKKRGIEVGCGLALPAVLGAKIGAHMTATDFHPDVEAWVAKNAELNQVRIDYRQWDWTAVVPADLGTFDFVLASDVLYESRHPVDLARALVRLVNPQGAIYLSDPGRGYLNQALDEIKRLGFEEAHFGYDVEESSHRPEIRLEQKRRIWVYEFTRIK